MVEKNQKVLERAMRCIEDRDMVLKSDKDTKKTSQGVWGVWAGHTGVPVGRKMVFSYHSVVLV